MEAEAYPKRIQRTSSYRPILPLPRNDEPGFRLAVPRPRPTSILHCLRHPIPPVRHPRTLHDVLYDAEAEPADQRPDVDPD